MKMLTISKSNETKPAIWIDSSELKSLPPFYIISSYITMLNVVCFVLPLFIAIHSREWITGAVCTYLINELLNNEQDTEIQSWLNNFDFYILPVANPDGYEYTHNTVKNRKNICSVLPCVMKCNAC